MLLAPSLNKVLDLYGIRLAVSQAGIQLVQLVYQPDQLKKCTKHWIHQTSRNKIGDQQGQAKYFREVVVLNVSS